MQAKIKLFTLLILCSPTLLTTELDVFLLKTYDGKKPVVGWVMSEKLDGIRGFWDGQQLRTRSGKVLNPPAWFIKDYPPFAIDGELWTKRADFENISSIVRQKNPSARWKDITHQIFEVPQQTDTLLERLAVLQHYLDKHPQSPIRIVKQIPITTKQQLDDFLDEVVQNGGEGVVIRDPSTPYQSGRLNSALKFKRYFDAECVTRKILPGKGKYTNKMGSLLCKMADGKLIKIGSGFKDSHRQTPPAIGTTITFKYYGLTKKGKPKYASFLRIRE